jgi:hypothetical protein
MDDMPVTLRRKPDRRRVHAKGCDRYPIQSSSMPDTRQDRRPWGPRRPLRSSETVCPNCQMDDRLAPADAGVDPYAMLLDDREA